MSIIELKGVSKFYYNRSTIASGFNKINLKLDMGEFVVITGESGSGKSTLLNVISGLDSYEEGEMYINGEETSHYTEVDYELYRRKYIGNIFQHFNLVNSYTVYQNIELALLFNGFKKEDAKKRVLEIMDTVGLTKYKNRKVSKLSGGQKQRVAIARALAKDTPIIVADEPTGNLDVKSAKAIMKLLYEISREKLVVIVTHNYEQVEEYATRKISMHDGKIIEDKKLKKTNPVSEKDYDFEDITLGNKLRLGIRNVFNIKVKFLLLFLVYFFLTSLVFSEYTSIKKADYDTEGYGYNYYFEDISPERVIVNKKDRSSFSKEELDKISKLSNVSKLVEDDLFVDMSFAVYTDDIYMYGRAKSLNGISTVDMGRLAENKNEVVLEISKYSYYLDMYGDSILNSEYSLQNNTTGQVYNDKVKIVGIIYSQDDSFYETNSIYMTDELFDEMRKGTNISYSSVDLEINNRIFSSDNYSKLYFTIEPLSKLSSGEVYAINGLNSFCNNYDCTGSNLKVMVKNMYYEDSVNLKIERVLSSENFRSLTGVKDYDTHASTIYISDEDYEKLFAKDSYQISIYLENTKLAEKTMNDLNNMGYNTWFMRDLLANELGNMLGIVKIIRGVVFIVATVVLFFISYFIIKIILKSRNIYFSTIRILGATRNQAKNLLNLELLIDVNIAYIVFLVLVFLVSRGLVDVDYIKDMITYFSVLDYIIVYLVLSLMSILISNRYAHKLFSTSAMNAYREEV